MSNKMKRKHLLGISLILSMLIMTACGSVRDVAANTTQDLQPDVQAYESELQETQPIVQEDEPDKSVSEISTKPDVKDETEEVPDDNLPTYGNYYYDVVNVALYLDVYNELPPNYITKSEAQALGWEGGSVEKYKEGAAIGGDYFGNREGLLPVADGRQYTECDIDTHGYSSRGSRRLVFSNDGLYFYTSDHYESFSEVTVTEDYEVIW